MSQHAHAPHAALHAGPTAGPVPPVDQPLDALLDGLVVVSATGLVLQANRAARESYGLQPFRSLPGPCRRAPIRAVIGRRRDE